MALALAFALGACRDGSPAAGGVVVEGEPVTREPRGRLVVLGIDGLPPDLLRAAIERGIVPNFAKLVREGVLGVVDVSAAGLPPLSPRIWTSFVTGQVPNVHGLKSFTYHDGADSEILYDSTMREVPALWNIASELGRSIGVVNWWTTAPAEAVRGFVVSDLFNDVALARLAKRLGAGMQRGDDAVVYPASLADELLSIPPVDRKIGVSPLRAEEVDANVFELAEVAVQQHPVDILLVYTRAFDELAHMGWHTHERRPGEDPGPDLVIDFLERYDWLLGRFLRRIRPEDHLMLLSDHGFERHPEPKVEGGTHHTEKTTRALFFVKGPRIRRGDLAEPIDICDVLPTMLELAGLPAADDLPGRIAAEVFRDGERDFLPRVASYELAGRDAVEVGRATSDGDEAMKERLRALGYLEGDAAGHGK